MNENAKKLTVVRRVKKVASWLLVVWLRATIALRDAAKNLLAHAHLASRINSRLPVNAVVLGKPYVVGTGNIVIGEHVLFMPQLHLETREAGRIEIGSEVVLSAGVHIASMSSVVIGDGTMVGEYTSIRDANHIRATDGTVRDAGYVSKPIVIGKCVWLGRGVTVLPGVTIGDNSTVGANAVVTRDVAAGATVVGVPAKPVVKT